nr:rhodanese-like domain-containing protein [Frankia sp. CcI49]
MFDAEQVRRLLLAREEIALLDLREEDAFAQEHPLWAANLPLSRLEAEVLERVPRLEVPVVVYGEHDGIDLAPRALARLRTLGYSQAGALAGGLAGWRSAGGELFRDVNVPSKAFGELVEAVRHTPSSSAQDVRRLLRESPPVVVDVRRYDEYQTMNIPSSVSVPGGELVLRIRELAPDPRTPIVVNCAGRTRSIIGTQSIINAGVPNPVVALRNGTIGWELAGLVLDHGSTRRAPAEVTAEHHAAARAGAREIARRAGVRPLTLGELAGLDDPARTTYRFDVRDEGEYVAGHLPGFRHAPGGQLVQETDHFAPVRGARLVLADDDGVRAAMTASWLAQMGWETYVLTVPGPSLTEVGQPAARRPAAPAVDEVEPAELATWLAGPTPLTATATVVVDIGPSREYVRGHVPGAWFAIRAQLGPAGQALPPHSRLVITSPTGELARWAVADLADGPGAADGYSAAGGPGGGHGGSGRVYALAGGTRAWQASGATLEAGGQRFLTPATDRYRRPYEGTDNAREAMQAYLDWEFGLIAQLERDGTHFFAPI